MSEILIENAGIAEFTEEILLPNDFTAKSTFINNSENKKEISEAVCYELSIRLLLYYCW
ncbi:MAG: hypothetical protein JXR58_05960 [Bacteroidales bacterium]|nr:hypothetical protein [Bacteroidales bacterium]